MTELKYINDANMLLNENDLLDVKMYENKNFDNKMNINILNATIKFIRDSERFDQPLFNHYLNHYCSFCHTLSKFLSIKSIVLKLEVLNILYF